MAFPDRAQLNADIDREFFAENPGAPNPLDPNDPSHADLIARWHEICAKQVNAWTDAIFKAFNPFKATPLDPTDPDDASYIEYWNNIRDQIQEHGPAVFGGTAAPTSP